MSVAQPGGEASAALKDAFDRAREAWPKVLTTS
jgi:hypothetical protein